jgi:phosphodiesterase/alkaline phosphatase D-like protein
VPVGRATAEPRPAGGDYPFRLGVASGDPTADGVVLWTRLAPQLFEPGGGMPSRRVAVGWQVAGDERFRHVVRRGRTWALPELAHSVHVEVDGLRPTASGLPLPLPPRPVTVRAHPHRPWAEHEVSNPVVVTGDWHSTFVNDIKRQSSRLLPRRARPG